MLAPWTGDLAGMVERRYIRVLVTLSRTNYFIDQAEQRGITYDAGKKFEEFLNARLKRGHLAVHVVFIPVRRQDLLSALREGRGDIVAANLTITPEREKLVAFSEPFATDVREVVVTAAGVPVPSSVEDLSGREVHVRRTSSYFESLTRLNAELAKAGKPPVSIVEADEQFEDEDVLEMVNAGVIPMTVVDDHVAAFWRQVFDGLAVQENVTVASGGRIGWGMRKDSRELKTHVDAFARTHGKGSLFGNVVLKRYYRDTTWVRNAASAEEQRKFRQLAQLFREYGDRYSFPWLLLAAQAYQESQLEQNRRSSAGAVGVMQIKPSTASGPPIFIKGVDRSVESNIHAGAKYLRFIMDEYFADEPIDRLNRGLFAVASYNAGPARVQRLRKAAAARGLDPNKWFGNVEIVAARDIGRETVQYVGNIYKYYVSYRLIADRMASKDQAKRRAG
jgi:membrane-bound lytic murein transglycosylase MltF